MKKLLFLLLFPIFCFAQSGDDYYNQAKSKHNIKDYYSAINNYDKSIKIWSDNSNDNYSLSKNLGLAYDGKARCYFSLKNYSKALENINKAISLTPNDKDCHHLRGLIKNQAGGAGIYSSPCLDFYKAAQLGHEKAKQLYKMMNGNPDFSRIYGCY